MLVDYLNSNIHRIGNLGPYTVKNLSDPNENKELGRIMILRKQMEDETKPDELKYGHILEKNCSSESEWDALVKQYMEE